MISHIEYIFSLNILLLEIRRFNNRKCFRNIQTKNVIDFKWFSGFFEHIKEDKFWGICVESPCILEESTLREKKEVSPYIKKWKKEKKNRTNVKAPVLCLRSLCLKVHKFAHLSFTNEVVVALNLWRLFACSYYSYVKLFPFQIFLSGITSISHITIVLWLLLYEKKREKKARSLQKTLYWKKWHRFSWR